MKLFFTKIALILVLFWLVLIPETAAQSSGVTILSGYKMDPPVATAAGGTIEVSLKGDSLYVEGRFSDLKNNYTGSGIFYEGKNEATTRLFKLKANLEENRKNGQFKKSENSFKLTPAQKELLREENLFIRISSSGHQYGEVRGQLPPLKES